MSPWFKGGTRCSQGADMDTGDAGTEKDTCLGVSPGSKDIQVPLLSPASVAISRLSLGKVHGPG